MSESVGDLLRQVNRLSDSGSRLNDQDEVYHGFVHTTAKDKKAAANDLKKAIENWSDPDTAKKISEHELGHALGDKKGGKFFLHAKVTEKNRKIGQASYKPVGCRSILEARNIIKSGGHSLSETDKKQLELIEKEINKQKKWWQFWK